MSRCNVRFSSLRAHYSDTFSSRLWRRGTRITSVKSSEVGGGAVGVVPPKWPPIAARGGAGEGASGIGWRTTGVGTGVGTGAGLGAATGAPRAGAGITILIRG